VGEGSYTQKVLWTFSFETKDGVEPYGGVIRDSAGNLFGTTYGGGSNLNQSNSGVVFELTP